MANEYEPKPIPVDHVVLDEEILELVELLAEHAHDLWALERMRDGWTFGPARDDAAREHPCLVPYSRLSERERDYDRTMVIGSVRAILALGFTISRAEPEPLEPRRPDPAADQLMTNPGAR